MKPEVSLSTRGACFLFVFVVCSMPNLAVADTIRLGGTISQSTSERGISCGRREPWKTYLPD
jgi:hypothetical protein